VDEDLLVNDDEQMIWRQSREEQRALNASGVLLEDMALQTYLNQIVRNLQPDDLPAKMSFNVRVVRDPYLNAFAFPSGTIYLHTGLLARMDNEAQLAALLAHEMAHCTQRHALQAFRSIKARSGFMASVQHTLARLTMVQDVTGFNRDFETEADVVGLDYMVSADYDPYEALRLFEHLKEEIEYEQIKEPYFFGTHPKVQARIDTIRRLLETTYADKHGGIKNREIFLSIVNPVILENAWLDLRSGRFWLAQRGGEKYLRGAENDADAYYLMGEIFRQRGREGDTEKALSYYRRATLTDPSYPEPHKAIGLIHYKDGHKALAKEFFEACLRLAPDSPDKAYIQGYIKQCMEDGEG
jgi:tetratricopeptide (TPR) repeat protein